MERKKNKHLMTSILAKGLRIPAKMICDCRRTKKIVFLISILCLALAFPMVCKASSENITIASLDYPSYVLVGQEFTIWVTVHYDGNYDFAYTFLDIWSFEKAESIKSVNGTIPSSQEKTYNFTVLTNVEGAMHLALRVYRWDGLDWVEDERRDVLVRVVKAEALIEDRTPEACIRLENLKNLLQERHLFNDTLRRPITKTILANYTVLVITGLTVRYGYTKPYSQDEVTAVREWTEEGGSLFLLGDIHAWNDLNQISSLLGVQFQQDIIEDPTNNYNNDSYSPIIHSFLSHDITKNLNQIVYSSGSSINVSDPACPIAFTDKDSSPIMAPVLAYGTFNSGRFVVIGDTDAMDDWGVSTPFDNKRLLKNIVGYLTSGVETVAVLVPDSLLSPLKVYLERYIVDLIEIGIASNSSLVVSGNWTKPEEVRENLQNLHASIGLTGSLLVGDIPAAWYEMESWDPPEHEEFAIDLFYMDLDGVWIDRDRDEKFDKRSGNIAPEIWIGRIKPPITNATAEILLLQNYFDKNHAYKVGNLTFPDKALAYVDDDWEIFSMGTGEAIGEAYPDYTLIAHNATTCKTDYLNRLTQGWELVHVECHGSPESHIFKIPNSTNPSQSIYEDTSIYGDPDIRTLDAPVLIYNLFICSACDFTTENYVGGWYIFTSNYSLVAVGSTKTGGMNWKHEFFRQLGQNSTIGEAFKEWFTASGDLDPSWTYGMVILGDPTLMLHGKGIHEFLLTDLNQDGTVNIVDISIVASAYGTRIGDDRYNSIADLDGNKQINIVDVSIVSMDYGKTV